MVLERKLIRIDETGIGRKHVNVLRREIQHLSKLCFLFPDLFFGTLQSDVFLLQFLLSPLAVFDIGTRNIPAHDLPLVVVHRIVASQMPTIASIMFAHPHLHVVSRAASRSTKPTSLYTFQVIRVSVSARAPLQPLIKADAEVIEHHAIGVKTFAARAEYRNKLGREIHDLSDLTLSLPDHRFCAALLADISNRSHELEVAQAIPRRVSGHTDMLNGTVGDLQAMFKIKSLPVTRRSIHLILHQAVVVRMNS